MNFTIEFFPCSASQRVTWPSPLQPRDCRRLPKSDPMSRVSRRSNERVPQKPDGLRILVQEERELFVWSRGDDDA
jgi:hypothetical protein